MNLNETDGNVENVSQEVAQTEIQEIAEPTENLVSEMETASEAIEEEVVAIEEEEVVADEIEEVTAEIIEESAPEVENTIEVETTEEVTPTAEIEVENETFKVDFYDNGDIDGDTISVFYNGKLIEANKRLTDKALNLTLLINPNVIINELIMYAENLGSIPPNTAVMIVTDGGKRYEVRIASDLKKSGVIRFVHKPK